MTARGIPDDPQFATDSEREVWGTVLEKGDSDWTVLANVRLTDEKKDHVLDLIVLMPDVGIVVVEVKGGDLRVEGGAWVVGIASIIVSAIVAALAWLARDRSTETADQS